MTAQKSILQNAYETTLALAIGADATETAVQVNAAPVGTPSASNPMFLVIDPDSDSTREYIKVTNRSGVSLTVVRNIDSDSGGLNAHAVGAKVRMVAMKQHFDDLNDRVSTIMNDDGTAVNTSGLVKDEDDMASDSATHLATQQSIKKYVDDQLDTKDTLAELDDVTITSVGDNDIIAYDNSSSKYINQTASEAGLATSAQGALADTAVQPASTNTLTNKTIDADGTGNSITNIEDANIKSAAAIDASKIADGSVSNAEFQRLDGVTSDIQTQLDAKGDVTASSTTTFTNKTIDADGTGNSITNIEDANIKSSAAIDAAKIADGSVSNAEFQRLDGVTSDIQTQLDAKGDVTASSTTTFTNKTIDADGTGNSITNIEDANIKSSAAIDASKIADGSVSNAEFQRLDGVTSDIQTQLDGKQASGSYITASSSDTLTNKTFDVEGTGNSISNIDVADFKAAAVVTEAEGIGSNDNDTTLPTSAAVKDYVDSNAGDVSASSTTTFTNKTIDANGTGNNISNIDIGNMTSAVIVTESEGIGSNDNDTTLPTSAAVVDYVANNAGSSNALVASDSDFTLTDGVASGIHYELDNTDMADWNQGGVALTAAGGIFRHNQTQSATYTISATEGTVLAGPITITGTVTNAGTMVIL